MLFRVRTHLLNFGCGNVFRVDAADPHSLAMHFEHDLRRPLPGEQKEFLLSFGYGFHKVNLAACEERFGLKVVINAGNLKSGIKSIDRKNLSSSPKLSRE